MMKFRISATTFVVTAAMVSQFPDLFIPVSTKEHNKYTLDGRYRGGRCRHVQNEPRWRDHVKKFGRPKKRK